MPYVGNKPEVGNFRKCDAITTSATATYNLLVGGVAVNPNQNQCQCQNQNQNENPPTWSARAMANSLVLFHLALTGWPSLALLFLASIVWLQLIWPSLARRSCD